MCVLIHRIQAGFRLSLQDWIPLGARSVSEPPQHLALLLLVPLAGFCGLQAKWPGCPCAKDVLHLLGGSPRIPRPGWHWGVQGVGFDVEIPNLRCRASPCLPPSRIPSGMRPTAQAPFLFHPKASARIPWELQHSQHPVQSKLTPFSSIFLQDFHFFSSSSRIQTGPAHEGFQAEEFGILPIGTANYCRAPGARFDGLNVLFPSLEGKGKRSGQLHLVLPS